MKACVDQLAAAVTLPLTKPQLPQLRELMMMLFHVAVLRNQLTADMRTQWSAVMERHASLVEAFLMYAAKHPAKLQWADIHAVLRILWLSIRYSPYQQLRSSTSTSVPGDSADLTPLQRTRFLRRQSTLLTRLLTRVATFFESCFEIVPVSDAASQQPFPWSGMEAQRLHELVLCDKMWSQVLCYADMELTPLLFSQSPFTERWQVTHTRTPSRAERRLICYGTFIEFDHAREQESKRVEWIAGREQVHEALLECVVGERIKITTRTAVAADVHCHMVALITRILWCESSWWDDAPSSLQLNNPPLMEPCIAYLGTLDTCIARATKRAAEAHLYRKAVAHTCTALAWFSNEDGQDSLSVGPLQLICLCSSIHEPRLHDVCVPFQQRRHGSLRVWL